MLSGTTGNVRHAVVLPLVLLIALLTFIGLYKALGLPTSEELRRILEVFFTAHGYLAVFVAGLLEAIPGVGAVYIPGSAVIVLAVAFSRSGALNTYLIVGIAVASFIVSYTIDYFLGRYGWYTVVMRLGLGPPLEHARTRILRHGLAWVWVTAFHPNFASVTATAAGILRVPFWQYTVHAVLATVVWGTFWALVAFFGANEILRLADLRLAAAVVAIWLVYVIIAGIRKGP